MGVFLHGLTADIGAPKSSYQAFIASDIIENIGNAYIELIA
jgi:NAD(P)H-hydrate repair Nnr-like enzyme with NAD(P)H-hydrate dehydratase domain